MPNTIFVGDSCSPALKYAGAYLQQNGWHVSPEPNGTVSHLLLPVPCRLSLTALEPLLAKLPKNITVICGSPDFELPSGYIIRDLLQDESYLAQNAAITAHCAMQLMADKLPVILCQQNILILGWGRIAKCLARLLHAAGNHVTIAARKEKDRATARSLLYDTVAFPDAESKLQDYRVICSTIPAPVLTGSQIALCRDDCLLLDLASVKGMDSDRVIHARGLPGKMAPESAGILIGETIRRLADHKEDTV